MKKENECAGNKDIEERLLLVEKRIEVLEEENDILKNELGNSIIEKVKLQKAKEKFVETQIAQDERYDAEIRQEILKREKFIREISERCNEIEKENAVLLSERSKGLLKETIRQAKISKKRTGENPFDLIEK